MIVRLLINLSGHDYVVKWNLTQLITRSADVGQRSFRWLKRGQACLHHFLVLGTAFPGGLSLHLAFGSFFYPHQPPPAAPFIFSTDKSVWPALALGLMAGRRGFTSHRDVTLSRDWLCKKGKPLDILGTHLHQATELLTICLFYLRSVKLCITVSRKVCREQLTGSTTKDQVSETIWSFFDTRLSAKE